MKLIQPAQISGEIMTLMDEADERLILVSPYFRVSQWPKLLKRLEAVRLRRIAVELYVREDEIDSIFEATNIGFVPSIVPNLHTKLYLNEKAAIVSSMNLLLSSDTNSLDIAMKTENQQEYIELFNYYTRFIKQSAKHSSTTSQSFQSWREHLHNTLSEVIGNTRIYETETKLTINAGNRYEAFISHGRTNDLRISGILSRKQYEFAMSNKKMLDESSMNIEVYGGKAGYYDMVWGTKKGVTCSNINEPTREDQPIIVESIVRFISGVEQFKKMAG